MDEAEKMRHEATADNFSRDTAYHQKTSIFTLLLTVLFVMFPKLPLRWLPPVPQPAPEPSSVRTSHGNDETPRIAAE